MKFLRRSIAVLGVLLVLVVLAAGGGILWVRGERGQQWLLDRMLGIVQPHEGSLVIAALETDVFSHLRIEGVVLRDAAGKEIAGIDAIDADYSLRALLRRTVRVSRLRVEGLRADVMQTEEGIDLVSIWVDPSVPPKPSSPYSGLPIDLVIDELDIGASRIGILTGTHYLALTDATLHGGLGFEGDRIDVTGLALDATSSPDLGPLALNINLSYDPRSVVFDTLDLTLGPHYVSVSGGFGAIDDPDGTASIHINAVHFESEALPWVLPVTGVFDMEGEITGLIGAPVLALQVTTPGGLINVDASLDRRPARTTWSAALQSYDVAVDAFVRELQPTVVDARVTAEGVGLGWPDDLDASGTIEGTARLAGSIGAASLNGSLALSKGVATMHVIEGSTSSGRIEADVRVDIFGRNGTVHVSSLNVDLVDLQRFGVTGLQGAARFVGDVDADWSGETPAATVGGMVSGVAVGYQDIAKAASFEGPIHLDWVDQAGSFSGSFAAHGVTAPSTRLNHARIETHGTVTQFGALELAAKIHASEISSGRSTVEALDAAVRVRRARPGDLFADLVLTTTAVKVGNTEGDRAIGTLSVVGNDIVARLDFFDSTRTIIGIDAAGDIETRHLRVSRLILSPNASQTWVGQGTQTVTIAEDGFDDLLFEVTSGSASIRANGSVHTRGAIALDVEAVDLPLALLEVVNPSFAGYSGIVGIKGVAGGSWSQVILAVDATADGIVVPGSVHEMYAKIHLDGQDGEVSVDASVANAKQDLATLKGSVPMSLDLQAPGLRYSQPVDLVLDVPSGTADEWNAVIDVVQIPQMRGAGHVQLSGSPLHPDLRVVAAVEIPSANTGDAWIDLDLDASCLNQQVQVTAAMREGDQQRVGLAGTARLDLDRIASSVLKKGPRVNFADPSTWAGDLDVTLTPDIPLQTLNAFVQVPDEVRGQLEGEVHAQGSLNAPVIDAQLSVREARLGTITVSPATLSFSPYDGGYNLDTNLGFGVDGSVRLVAFLPLELRIGSPLRHQFDREGLKVDVSGEGVPLQAVSTLWPDMQEASGRVRINGTLGGSLAVPSGHLEISAEDVRFRLESTGVAYDQVRFGVDVAPDAIRLRELHVRTSVPGRDADRGVQGTIEGAVEARIQGTTLGEWKGQISFDRSLLYAKEDRYLRLSSGKLSFSGVPPDVKLTGALQVEEARIRFDDRFFRGLASREAPAWLHVHRGNPLQEADLPTPPPTGIPNWLEARLRLDLGRNTFLQARLPLGGSLASLLGPFSTMYVDTQVDGTLRLNMRDDVVSLVGQVVPLRGTAVLFGKPFQIRSDSSLSFTGRDYSNPEVFLHAVHDTGAYGTVEATISGIPDSLTVALTSSQYPSQDDVISLLIIGKPSSEMSAEEGATDGASAAAMSMLLTTIGQTLGREGERSSEMIIAPDLLVLGSESARIGKRIGKRLFVVVDIDNTADDLTTSYLLLTIELGLGGPWEAQFTHGTAGQDSMEVNWTRRY